MQAVWDRPESSSLSFGHSPMYNEISSYRNGHRSTKLNTFDKTYSMITVELKSRITFFVSDAI